MTLVIREEAEMGKSLDRKKGAIQLITTIETFFLLLLFENVHLCLKMFIFI